MRNRTRTVVLRVLAALASLASLTLLVLLPLSRDASGDLRELVEVAPDGGLTFAGTGVGTPSSPSDPLVLGTLPQLDTLRGDFGTTFFVMGEAREGRVRDLALFYEGNPLAVLRLLARWREVFERAGGECVFTGRCMLVRAGDDPRPVRIRATLSTELSWYGPSGVTVRLSPW